MLHANSQNLVLRVVTDELHVILANPFLKLFHELVIVDLTILYLKSKKSYYRRLV